MALWTVHAAYDPEAHVWYATEGDVPGLAADADTIELLAAKIGPMILDLVEIHAADLTPEQISGPHHLNIVAHHEHAFDVAA